MVRTRVITSYSIHYTKLYERQDRQGVDDVLPVHERRTGRGADAVELSAERDPGRIDDGQSPATGADARNNFV